MLAPATLAALPSTRAIPDRDVFYVADPISSIEIDSCAPAHFDLSVCPSMSLASPRLHSFAVEFHLARAFEDEIKLLRDLVIMPLCPASRGDARFRKALILNGRIRAIENGAFGKSDVEGKAATVAASEVGSERVSIERIVEPSLVMKGACAERFWTVIVSNKDASSIYQKRSTLNVQRRTSN